MYSIIVTRPVLIPEFEGRAMKGWPGDLWMSCGPWNPVKCLVMPTSPSVRYSNKVNWNRSSAGNLAMVGPLISEQFDVALRNDLVDERQGVRGWKN